MAKHFTFTKEQIVKAKYLHDGSTALTIKHGWETVCRPTVCVPGSFIEPDEVLIKNYSENEGVLQDLIDMGVVGKPIREISSGHITIYVCKLLI